MKSLLDQLSPTNRYYLGKLLKKAGKSFEPTGEGTTSSLPELTPAQFSQLENLLYFHQTVTNQHASSENNLEQVTALIFSLLDSQQPTESQSGGFGQPSLSEEQLVVEGLVDRQVLIQMPFQELVDRIEGLRQGLEKSVSFVNDQEEELRLQGEAVQELQQRLEQCSEYDRMVLEVELVSERQNYEFLDATLMGQRKRIQTEQQLLQLHQDVLRFRQES
jgi:hypothetical protein